METNNVEDKALQDNIILRRILTPPLPAAGLSARSATIYTMGFEEFYSTEMNSQ
jgi:hypothetical protein